MKKSFTLLELIFVIIIIGVLAVFALPKLRKNNLPKAAAQLISHIRYTQHLAMIDDKFNSSTGTNWYQSRWRISFSKSLTDTNNKYAYTIFSDTAGGSAGNPDPQEVAINPLDKNKKLTGGAAGASMIHTGDSIATNEMNIGEEYDVLDVDFSANCRTGTTSKTIAFDHIGRPIRGALSNFDSAYHSSSTGTNILISGQCVIDLCSVSDCKAANVDEIISIAIEPESGYVHLLKYLNK